MFRADAQMNYAARKHASSLRRSGAKSLASRMQRDHDAIVALTSHLPQFIAYAFSQCVSERASSDPALVDALCGPAARELLRLGRSSPQMWDEIFAANRRRAAKRTPAFSGRLSMLVGFQGEPGAFSEEAAARLFGAVESRGYLTFDALVEAVDTGEIPVGLLPCENSIHGPVTRAYDLLYTHPRLRIVDETVHRIVQNAHRDPRNAISTHIRRVESHPVALEQCRRFLASLHGIEVVAVADTAGAVRDVASP